MHRFWYNQVYLLAGNNVMAFSLLGGAAGDLYLWILKGDPDFISLFNCHYGGDQG